MEAVYFFLSLVGRLFSSLGPTLPPSHALLTLSPLRSSRNLIDAIRGHRERNEKKSSTSQASISTPWSSKKSALAALAASPRSLVDLGPVRSAASPSLSVQALQEGKIYYAKDVPELKLSKAPAKAGTLDCRSKRTIPTWNNEEVVVCDSALCKGCRGDAEADGRGL